MKIGIRFAKRRESKSAKFLRIVGDAGEKGVTRKVLSNVARTRALLPKDAPESRMNGFFSTFLDQGIIRPVRVGGLKTKAGKVRKHGLPYVLTAKGKAIYKQLKVA